MARNYVYSTLSAPVDYINFVKGANNVPQALRCAGREGVFIHGGHGVATLGKSLITPQGVVTEVSDEQLTYLQENPVFQRHQKNGFIIVESKRVDPEKVAASMATADGSAPLAPSDFPGDGVVEPKVMTDAPTKRRGFLGRGAKDE